MCYLYFGYVALFIWTAIVVVVVREIFYNQPVRRKQMHSRYMIIIMTIHLQISLLIHRFAWKIILLLFIIFCRRKENYIIWRSVSCKLHLFIHLFQSDSLILTGLLLCYACHFFVYFYCIFAFKHMLTCPFCDYREDEFLCTAPSSSPLPLISKCFGDDVSKHLHEVAASEQDWVLSGHISGPTDVFCSKVSPSCNCWAFETRVDRVFSA